MGAYGIKEGATIHVMASTKAKTTATSTKTLPDEGALDDVLAEMDADVDEDASAKAASQVKKIQHDRARRELSNRESTSGTRRAKPFSMDELRVENHAFECLASDAERAEWVAALRDDAKRARLEAKKSNRALSKAYLEAFHQRRTKKS